ncbi:hypothetical protein QRO11_08080 [Paracidovorax citrulli]|uniref:Uncharacterized protein n=2 Tax=Paracidovorax citrulli TaxID=80869 RepID=A1TNU5_PARC0|nr:DUF6714 family protein [Paracidovorax citrulli]ABM32633.1 hypothetical protein Aave_2050 [Paracidovorax citrulli AAC00-1]PVY66850.1 hypothetical protein C8E08_4275 [Paracidovorax citrulli]QCX09245.1 hypothetical protein APS58_0278 [Paracidovorax citrulli]REG68987.1 hypothetical protein C8E07_2116 [Paracidovorax citrulli]RLJ93542.1 hypothetical protein C8E06_2116 [Paracidovorax citrulli]
MTGTSKNAALLVLMDGFSGSLRPQAFNDFLNVDEEFCEHNALLQSRDHQSLTREDLGSVGWNPIGCMNVAGWRYWLPALGRIALSTDTAGRGYFMWDLLVYLKNPESNPAFLSLTQQEREAVARFLKEATPFVRENLEPEVEVGYDLKPVQLQWEMFSRGEAVR